MAAIQQLQKALSKNYYETFIISQKINSEYNFNIYTQDIIYKGEQHYEKKLDLIQDDIKIIIRDLKPIYYNTISEVHFKLAKLKTSEEKINYLSNLISTFEITNIQLYKDILIDEKNSNYHSKINDLSEFKSFNELTAELFRVAEEPFYNSKENFTEDYNVDIWKLEYYNLRASILGFLPSSLFAISNSFIKFLDNLIDIQNNANNPSKLEWAGTSTQLGFIFGELVSLGFIIAPEKSDGEINYSALAREMNRTFKCNFSVESLSKYLNGQTAKARETRNKFEGNGYSFPHKNLLG